MRCGGCGQDNPDGFRFCGNCGAPLTDAQARPREVRKVVTVVFCDLAGSTARGDVTDPEALRSTMRGYYEQMRGILERHGGTVEKFIGDAVMAVFGVPVAREDDAVRAVRAAWEMRAAVPELDLAARIGVNTGEVVAGEGDTLVTGDAVNVAARLEQAAEPGEVLIGSETRRLVRDAVQVEAVSVAAKGKAEPVQAFRLLDVDLDAAPLARRLDTPLVGRRAELEQLTAAFERTVRERRCHLFTLLGAAGVGKSRLVAEFLGSIDAQALHGRCLDYGEGITFWPIISVLKQLGEQGDETVAQIDQGASTAQELFWSVRAKLEEVAAERPLVVVLDDIHWGEETFLDLVDHVADLSRGAPLLLLCVARPDLLEKRPGWGGGKLNATTVLLEPLSPEDCAELIATHEGLDGELRTRILAAAGGNPLFVEEMVALAQEGGDVRVPSTVQALLQARLDQLGAEERTVIERGAVEGEIFHRGAVRELAQVEVAPQLDGLVRKELIQPTPTTFAGDHAFRFRHLLVRDAAYDALPKEVRSELHERFASWLGEHGRALIELEEVLGYHLEQAALYRRELGRPSADLERRAGSHLATAGHKAAVRNDTPSAASLLGRALDLLPEDDPRWRQSALVLLLVLGDIERVDDRLRLIERLEGSTDQATALHGRIERARLTLMRDPTGAVAASQRTVAEAKALADELADDLLAAHAFAVAAVESWLQSNARGTIDAYDELRERSARLGVPALARAGGLLSGPLFFGPFTPDEVLVRAAALRAGDLLGPHVEKALAGMIAYREGRYDEGLAQLAAGTALAGELGLTMTGRAFQQRRGQCLLQLGRPDEAMEVQREVVDYCRLSGSVSLLSTSLVLLGRITYALGDFAETERLVSEGTQLGADEDVINFAMGGELRARLASDGGEHGRAEREARVALEYAYRTDFTEILGGAHESLAYVLAAAGRRDEARAELERALAIWERYVYTLETARVRDALARL